MFKFKKKARYTIVVGDLLEVINIHDQTYINFRVSEIKYSESLASFRVYGRCVDGTNKYFKTGEEVHLFGLEYVMEHIERKVIKLIKYEPKNL